MEQETNGLADIWNGVIHDFSILSYEKVQTGNHGSVNLESNQLCGCKKTGDF